MLANPVLLTGCLGKRVGTVKRVSIDIVRPFRNIFELHSRNYSIRGVFSAIMAVSVAATLCGCATQGIVFATSENLCQDWRAISVSKNDKLTEQTASEIEANNKSRPAWGCNKNG